MTEDSSCLRLRLVRLGQWAESREHWAVVAPQKLQCGLTCPKDVLPDILCCASMYLVKSNLTSRWFCLLRSSSLQSTLSPAADGADWRWWLLTLMFTLKLCGGWSASLLIVNIIHPTQFVIPFSLAATSREAGSSHTHPKTLGNTCNLSYMDRTGFLSFTEGPNTDVLLCGRNFHHWLWPRHVKLFILRLHLELKISWNRIILLRPFALRMQVSSSHIKLQKLD